jgi:hypothetical protein
MRYIIDVIEEYLILRKLRSGCLEGRTPPLRRVSYFFRGSAGRGMIALRSAFSDQ